jgi:hypothetical protein
VARGDHRGMRRLLIVFAVALVLGLLYVVVVVAQPCACGDTKPTPPVPCGCTPPLDQRTS